MSLKEIVFRKVANLRNLVIARTFNIERTIVSTFSFCIGFTNELALGVLKRTYITKIIRKHFSW